MHINIDSTKQDAMEAQNTAQQVHVSINDIASPSTAAQVIKAAQELLQNGISPSGGVGTPVSANPGNLETILKSLMDALTNSMQQVQQLKLKNMMLTSSKTTYESRHEVEGNLQRHEYERVKTQMLQETHNLSQQLKLSNGKVQKYKKRIVDKNKEINKLLKLLNDNSIDVTQIELSAVEPSSTSSIRIKSPEDISKNRRSDMLQALGALATQVLNDDTEDGSINQTYIQSSMKAEDENVTEAEISVFNGYNNQNNPSSNVLLHKFSNGPILPEIKDNAQRNPVVLPKMRSFSTVDNAATNNQSA